MTTIDLQSLAAQWSRFRVVRDLAQALAVGLVAGAFVTVWSALAGIFVALGATTVVAWSRRGRWRITASALAAHLDRSYAELEESSALWLRAPGELTLLEQLQRRRLDVAWAALLAANPCAGQPPAHGLRVPLGQAMAALLIFIGVGYGIRAPSRGDAMVAPSEAQVGMAPAVQVPTALRSAMIALEPPAYMQRPSRQITGLDGEAEEGAVLRWEIQTTEDVTALAIVTGAAAEPVVRLAVVAPGRFSGQASARQTLLYQLAGTKQDGSAWAPPEIHAIKVVPDQVPRLAFASPVLSRTPLEPENPRIEISVVATDDFGIGDVHLVATVAKGSGEGVKFRDLELPLTTHTENDVTTWRRTLDAREFDLEPGDEVYFHAVASDTRAPQPQSARTETRFAVMPGAESALTDPGVSVTGVNLIPEYFRSQRQLIIDTQRLVAARPILPPDVFARHSDAIGVDQKLLRLRYGQFLGEEFEPELSGAPAAPGLAVDEHGHASAGGVSLPGSAAGGSEASERPSLRPEVVDSIQQQFMHNHDKPEAATFFGETVKASLRQVLAAMWEAEGFLRTARPAEALPAENRALEMLKELQQADRVYVKRMGFEPPVIRVEERRLSGELEAIPRSATTPPVVAASKPLEDALRAQLAAITRGGINAAEPDPARDALVETGLAAAAQADPERFLSALSAWRTPASQRSEAERQVLGKALWSLLPEPDTHPTRPEVVRAGLTEAFTEALRTSSEGTP
ncbi:MAG TPA: hypothetical protein VGD88_14045 [Opitutaceae bacterium]